MTSIISNAYHNHPEKKDGAYSMYYMGVNAGAFLGMLCGYIGEKFLGVGVWTFYVVQNATVLFYSGHIWRYWFKTNCCI
jgi:dipeptide/tripeptide permease